MMKERDFIYLKLNRLNDKIISKNRLVEIIKITSDKNIQKKLELLRKTNKVKYIFLNYYYIVNEIERKNKIYTYSSEEMIISVLNKLKIKWHYSLDTALTRKKIVWQTSKNIIILNNKLSKKFVFNQTPFYFIKTQDKYIFDKNIIKTKNRISAYYPSNEKLLIDYIYFKKKVPKELIAKVKEVNIKKLIKNYPIIIQNKIKK